MPPPVGRENDNAVNVEPSVLCSTTNSDPFDAVVLFDIPKLKLNDLYPVVFIPAIIKLALPPVFVKKTFPFPEEPV